MWVPAPANEGLIFRVNRNGISRFLGFRSYDIHTWRGRVGCCCCCCRRCRRCCRGGGRWRRCAGCSRHRGVLPLQPLKLQSRSTVFRSICWCCNHKWIRLHPKTSCRWPSADPVQRNFRTYLFNVQYVTDYFWRITIIGLTLQSRRDSLLCLSRRPRSSGMCRDDSCHNPSSLPLSSTRSNHQMTGQGQLSTVAFPLFFVDSKPAVHLQFQCNLPQQKLNSWEMNHHHQLFQSPK